MAEPRVSKLEVQLAHEETSLRERVLQILPAASVSG